MTTESPRALYLTDSGGFGPQGDLELSSDVLRTAAITKGFGRLIRIYRPEPTLAFSRRETHLPGFESAVTLAAGFGFAPVVRPTGGRAVSYDQSCLVMDVIDAVASRHLGQQEAFAEAAGAISRALSACGVDAQVGEIPGEYCPGAFSVNARRTVKIAGISQRVISGARLVSAMIPVSPSPFVVEALSAVYRTMKFEWDPDTFGSISNEAPAATFADLSGAIRQEFSPDGVVDMSFTHFTANTRVPHTIP